MTARQPSLESVLTDRQREVLSHVVARGYYQIPRTTTLRKLARELGISTTSLSLILRRAELKIVPAFVELLDE